jgi:hypothetical protein
MRSMQIFLTTDRLALRPFSDTEDDLDLVVELDSDPAVTSPEGGR